MIIMGPIYSVGEPKAVGTKENENYTIINDITVVNITDNKKSLRLAYTVALLFTSGCGYYMLHKYRQKYKSF
jgi:hypothetical protein